MRRRSLAGTLAPKLTWAQGVSFYRGLLQHERDYHRDSVRSFTSGRS